jgi:Starch-binding associating with outer membrane
MLKFIAIMKKQISILLLSLFIFTACEKQLLRKDEILQKRDALESATPSLLLSSVIQKSTFVYQAEGGASNKMLATAVQFMQGNRNSDDNIYKNFAKPNSELYNLTAQIKLVQAAINDVHKKGLKNYEGIFIVFKTLLWSTATDLYGDMYYTEGLRGQDGILFPKFDEQKDIYPALIQDLKDATQLLTEGTEEIDQTYDIMYGGDKSKWIKLSNSLRLRLLMRSVKNLPNGASEIAAVAALPLITANSENAAIEYKTGDVTYSWPMGGANMPFQQNFLIMRPSKTLVDTLKTLNDNRLKVWVAPLEKPWTNNPSDNGVVVNTTDPNGFSYTSTWEYIDRSNPLLNNVAYAIQDSLTLYAGYEAGMYAEVLYANGSYDFPDSKWNYKVSTFSKLLNQNAHPLIKATVIQADEVHFLLAEAAVKGYVAGADAETLYKRGVELAMNRWGQSLPGGYFDNAAAKFPASGTNEEKLAKIGLQKWLGLFMMGVEAYSDLRRTGIPAIEHNGKLANGLNAFPLRLRYPESEMANNAQNYSSAVSKLDKGDNEYSKMWLIK